MKQTYTNTTAAYRKTEQGVASILTVIFFILIGSVITVGFLRLSLTEGVQAREDSLSKAALAAAYSGVNDARQAILYCVPYKDITNHECNDDTASGINNQACPGFIGNDAIRNVINPTRELNADGSFSVVDDPTSTVNERYTCVTIKSDTQDVSGPLHVDRSDSNTTLIPLRSNASFSSVRISWHQRGLIPPDLSCLNYTSTDTSATGCGFGAFNVLTTNYRSPNAYGNYFEWNPAWPAQLRMSIFSYPRTGISYDANGQTNIVDKTTHLYPYAMPLASTSWNVGSLMARQSVRCSTTGYAAAGGQYLCQITLTGFNASNPSFNPGTHTLYLQLSNQYVDTDYAVELLGAGGSPVQFDDVSPEVDATGAVGDVYRRVKVRLRYNNTPILPNALDTGAGICKNFVVGTGADMFSEDCGY